MGFPSGGVASIRGRRARLMALAVVLAVLAALIGVLVTWGRGPSGTSGTPSRAIDAVGGSVPGGDPADSLPRPNTFVLPTPKARPNPRPRPVAAPVWRNQEAPSGNYVNVVSIPAQGVLAPVDGPCVRRDGGIEPASYDPRVTCIWDLGAQLGSDQGEATILGHINYGGVDGALGRIGQLHVGDSVFTYDARGVRTHWKVSAVVQRPKVQGVDPTAEKGPYGPKTLVMVTCGGQWVGGDFGYADLFWVHAVPA